MKTKMGDELEIATTGTDEHMYSVPVLKKWKVIGVYKNHILCECDGTRECFTYGQLVQLGIEKQAEPFEALRQSRNEHWAQHS